MRHIPIAFDLLGILSVLYVLVLAFDAETTGSRAPSRPRASIPLLGLFRGSHSLPANADRKAHPSSFDTAYARWRMEFVSFEASCFRSVCEFVRMQFDNLLDHYYGEGHESLNDFPAWAFERYLCAEDRMVGTEDVRRSSEARTHLADKRSDST